MSSSTRSRAVGGECAWWTAESVVERDRGGEGEEAGGDPCPEPGQGAGTVALEREEVLAGPEDRFDPLADRGQVRTAAGLVPAPRAHDQRLERGGVGLELAAGVALVADHGQMARAVHAPQQRQADLALADLRAGQLERPRGAVGGEQRVQAKTPEEAAVAGAVAVVGGVGERRAAGRLERAGAFDRGRVDQQQILLPARTVAGELRD